VAYYLDTSALVKLVVGEAETGALRQWLAEAERDPVSSDLARTELLRAVRRAAPDRLVAARAVLDGVTLLELTTAIFETAARLDPAVLRSLDALHVAAAVELGDELDGVVTYDERLAAAAATNGIPVVSPGA
jgi:predicted nucleic acid-binding protein